MSIGQCELHLLMTMSSFHLFSIILFWKTHKHSMIRNEKKERRRKCHTRISLSLCKQIFSTWQSLLSQIFTNIYEPPTNNTQHVIYILWVRKITQISVCVCVISVYMWKYETNKNIYRYARITSNNFSNRLRYATYLIDRNKYRSTHRKDFHPP